MLLSFSICNPKYIVNIEIRDENIPMQELTANDLLF